MMKRLYWASLMVFFAFATPAMAATYRLHVLGMYCPFCAYSLHHKLTALSGVRSATVDLKAGLIVIQTDPGKRLAESSIKQLVTDSGQSLQSFRLIARSHNQDRSAP